MANNKFKKEGEVKLYMISCSRQVGPDPSIDRVEIWDWEQDCNTYPFIKSVH